MECYGGGGGGGSVIDVAAARGREVKQKMSQVEDEIGYSKVIFGALIFNPAPDPCVDSSPEQLFVTVCQ